MKLRDLTSSGEHMNYLLDNGYTEDAKRLFEEQYTEGRQAKKIRLAETDKDWKTWPYAFLLGYSSTEPVDDWINLYFEDVS